MLEKIDLYKEVRKTYKIKDSDNFWPYVFKKSKTEGLEKRFLNKIKPEGRAPFIGVLSYAMPPPHWTGDNCYYENRAIFYFIFFIVVIFSILFSGFFFDLPFLKYIGFTASFLFILFLFIPTKFTSKYWEKIQYSDYLYFITEKIKDKEDITDLEFQLFNQSYGREHTLYAIEQILLKNKGSFKLSNFLYYAKCICDYRSVSISYFWNNIKENKEKTPHEIKEQALNFYNRKLNK